MASKFLAMFIALPVLFFAFPDLGKGISAYLLQGASQIRNQDCEPLHQKRFSAKTGVVDATQRPDPYSIDGISPVGCGKPAISSHQNDFNLLETSTEFIISCKVLLALIAVAGGLGYTIGILFCIRLRYTYSSGSSNEDTWSPVSDGEDISDKTMDIEGLHDFYDCRQQKEEFDYESIIDNANFYKNFCNHEKISATSRDEIYTAVHILDMQTYMIKKIKIYSKNTGDLYCNQRVQEIIGLKKINSKYIARYITSWLEEVEEAEDFGRGQKKLVLCIQMEIYTDKVLKEWLGLGLENKIICCKIFRQLAKAIKHIHEKGIFHGSLKTKNIFLDRKRNIKLTNFSMRAHNRDDPRARKEKDIVDLAAVLVELFMQFESKEERKNVLRRFRDDRVIPGELKNNFNEVCKIVEVMVNQPSKEGLIEQILAHRLINYST